MKKIILLLIVAFAMHACSQKLDVTTISNSKWTLSEWPGQTMPVNAQATLNFDGENKITGKSFCNSYGGNSLITGKTVKFEQLFSTKMFCNEFSNAENKYQTDLVSVNTLELSGSKLKLLKDGAVIMVFEKAQ